jgi:hypothetical protein
LVARGKLLSKYWIGSSSQASCKERNFCGLTDNEGTGKELHVWSSSCIH